MRLQDEKKKQAILNATIKLVNETGFAAASVAKIAKEANVSPATIYIYHKNKEDLLVSIFIQIDNKKRTASMKGFDESSPLKQSFRKVWYNTFKFASAHGDYLKYNDQFLTSPYIDLIDDLQNKDSFKPFLSALESGAKEKVIKKVDFSLLSAFVFQPLWVLTNSGNNGKFKMTRKNIETAFEMAWDAIRL